ncbi:DUF3488 and transglutaminase-like domain-containing protein [Nocardioides sp. GXZ039]|uniref:DUF3488 and transglutaminase-like domain-containing protein n=1 Tax=Nocardioides sp. GXZ039 TaxID=3136018 RepID=UPI0030F46D38
MSSRSTSIAPSPQVAREPAGGGPAASDVLCALIGGGIVLLGWRTTFAGSGWWIAGLAAAVLAVMVVIVVRDAGGRGELVGLALALGYVAAAGPLSRGSLAIDGWDVFLDGLTSTGEIWRTLLVTHPPIDSDGAALLPPILTAILSAGFSMSLAMGSRIPAAPLLALIPGLAVVLVLGQHEPASIVGLGAGAALLMACWVRLRADRLDRARFGLDPGRRRRAVLAAVIVLGCALLSVQLLHDRSDGDRFVLRDQVRPYSVAGIRTPLDEFRSLVLSDRRLFFVDGLPGGSRLRFAALDQYDGQSWSAENDTDPARDDDRFLHVSSTTRNPASGAERTVTIRATGEWRRPWVPTIGAVQSFEFDGPDDELGDELLYNPATQTAVLPDGLTQDVSYTVITRDTDVLADRDMRESTLLDQDLYRQGPVLDQVIAYWKSGYTALTPVDAVFKVAAGIRKEGRYSHGVQSWEQSFSAGHDLHRLTTDFLLAVPSVGDEEQYAAAMALLANRMRVPARVVVGAIVPDDGVVRGSDVTAWVELRAADGTWRTLPTETFMGRRPPDRLDATFPTPRDYHPRPEQDDRPDEPPPETNRPDETVAEDSGPADRRPWWLLAIPLGAMAAGAVPMAKWWRRRRRLGGGAVSTRYAGAWDELVDRARDLGHDVPVGVARPTQARAIDGTADLADEADRSIYTAEPPNPTDAREYWARVHRTLDALNAGESRWRRARATFSLRSLRSR